MHQPRFKRLIALSSGSIDYRTLLSSEKILLSSTSLERDNFRLGVIRSCKVGIERIYLENVLELTCDVVNQE